MQIINWSESGEVEDETVIFAKISLGDKNDVENAVKEVKKGKIEFRVDKNGVIHTIVGKASFDKTKLIDNCKTIGVSSGASAPEILVEEFINSLKKNNI